MRFVAPTCSRIHRRPGTFHQAGRKFEHKSSWREQNRRPRFIIAMSVYRTRSLPVVKPDLRLLCRRTRSFGDSRYLSRRPGRTFSKSQRIGISLWESSFWTKRLVCTRWDCDWTTLLVPKLPQLETDGEKFCCCEPAADFHADCRSVFEFLLLGSGHGNGYSCRSWCELRWQRDLLLLPHQLQQSVPSQHTCPASVPPRLWR